MSTKGTYRTYRISFLSTSYFATKITFRAAPPSLNNPALFSNNAPLLRNNLPLLRGNRPLLIPNKKGGISNDIPPL